MAHNLRCMLIIGLLAQTQLSVATPAQRARSDSASTTWSYSSFTYAQMSTNRYATPLPSPLSTKTFAPIFSEASSLLPTSVIYTTYSLDREAISTDDGPYGQSAYAALWENTTYTDAPPFTTTVSPTPIPSSELVFPPPLAARPLNYAEDLMLPEDFIWGSAASAFQIEGGLQFGGRGPAVFDSIGTGATAASNDSNVADMSYFMYKQDIARLAALGVPYYSLSISWTRVVPFGIAGSPVNTEALDHYEDVIDTCYEYGVTPIVTLTHADTPVSLFDDLSTLPENYVYYAKQMMTRLGDRIPIWFTFNEPNFAVPYYSSDWNSFAAVMRAHAEIYHWYKDELQGTGQISMKFANNLAVPLDPSNEDDVEACFRYQDFELGIMANPLFLGEQFPEVVLNTPGINMTALTDEEISTMNGTVDFWAFDPYVAQFGSAPPGGYEACKVNSSNALWPSCTTLGTMQANGWLIGVPFNAYPYIAPQYIREQYGYVWNTFKPSAIMTSEFGFPQLDESEQELSVQLYDFDRAMYYQNFLTETLHAIHSDGVNIIGALAWSAADNNEFGSYAEQYGLQTVNRTDGLFERHYKRSFFDFVDFFHAHIPTS